MDTEQVKAEVAGVLRAIAHGDQCYRYNSPFMLGMVRWDAVQADLFAILDRHTCPAEGAGELLIESEHTKE